MGKGSNRQHFWVYLNMRIKEVVKVWAIVLSMLGPVAGMAQERHFYGRLVNKKDVGLPNSFVKIKGRNESFACDTHGGFNFRTRAVAGDSVVFFAQGHYPETIEIEGLPEDSIIVEMRKVSNTLQEAVVGAHSNRLREAVSGHTGSLHQAGCYLLFKDEIALWLPADSTRNGVLKDVNVYITKEGKAHRNKFQVHIYLPDSTGAPGEEVTDTALVLAADRGNEWVSADIANRKIQAGKGLFLSVEWIFGYDNDGFPWPLHGQTNYYAGNDSLRQFYNGQVLGLNWQEGKPRVYRRYARTTYEKTSPDKWFLTPPTLGGCRRGDCITPMMYYTYTYMEK